MSKHTPGPWAYDRNQETLTGADGAHVMTLGDCWPQGGNPNEWDAALIAAAPDLLEALEGMMSCFDDGVGEHWSAKELDAARAAIARAKGESQ